MNPISKYEVSNVAQLRIVVDLIRRLMVCGGNSGGGGGLDVFFIFYMSSLSDPSLATAGGIENATTESTVHEVKTERESQQEVYCRV